MYDISDMHPKFQGMFGYFSAISTLSVMYKYVVQRIIMPQYSEKQTDVENYYAFMFSYFMELYNFQHVIYGNLFYRKYIQVPRKRDVLLQDLVYSMIVYAFCEIVLSVTLSALGYRHIPMLPMCFLRSKDDVRDVLTLPSQMWFEHCVSLLVLLYDPGIFKAFNKYCVVFISVFHLIFWCFYKAIISTRTDTNQMHNGVYNAFYFNIAIFILYECEGVMQLLKKHYALCDIASPLMFNTILTFLINYTGKLAQSGRNYINMLLQSFLEYLNAALFAFFLLLFEESRCYHKIYQIKFLYKYIGRCHFYMPYASVIICALYSSLFENIQFGPFHYFIVFQMMLSLGFLTIGLANFMSHVSSKILKLGQLM